MFQVLSTKNAFFTSRSIAEDNLNGVAAQMGGKGKGGKDGKGGKGGKNFDSYRGSGKGEAHFCFLYWLSNRKLHSSDILIQRNGMNHAMLLAELFDVAFKVRGRSPAATATTGGARSRMRGRRRSRRSTRMPAQPRRAFFSPPLKEPGSFEPRTRLSQRVSRTE